MSWTWECYPGRMATAPSLGVRPLIGKSRRYHGDSEMQMFQLSREQVQEVQEWLSCLAFVDFCG